MQIGQLVRLRPLVRREPLAAAPPVASAHAPDGVTVSASKGGFSPLQAWGTARAIRFDGMSWAGNLQANGGRDGLVLVPRGMDPTKPVEVVVYFHGNGSTATSAVRGLRPLIEQLPAHGRNAVVVVPTGGVKERWMNPKRGESLTALQDEGVAIASRLAGRPLQVASYTVMGHSGGGLPIATAANAGQLRASRINLFDSTYGAWGEAAVRGRQPGATVHVSYTSHNEARAKRLLGKPGVTVERSTTNHGHTPAVYFYR